MTEKGDTNFWLKIQTNVLKIKERWKFNFKSVGTIGYFLNYKIRFTFKKCGWIMLIKAVKFFQNKIQFDIWQIWPNLANNTIFHITMDHWQTQLREFFILLTLKFQTVKIVNDVWCFFWKIYVWWLCALPRWIVCIKQHTHTHTHTHTHIWLMTGLNLKCKFVDFPRNPLIFKCKSLHWALLILTYFCKCHKI